MDNSILNIDNYSLSFLDEDIEEKIRAVFSESESEDLKVYAANVLIGNAPARKLNDSVGDYFKLCGFYVKDFVFRDSERKGKYTVMFGKKDNDYCAYSTSSDKVFEALMYIVAVFGEPSKWQNSIPVRIRMNQVNDKSGNISNAYSLEVCKYKEKE